MSSLADAFDAPLAETVGGKTYSLPLMEMDDLAALSREIINEQKVKALAQLPLGDTAAKADTSAWFDTQEMDIEELSKAAKTLPGAHRYLTRSFIAGNNPASELPQFLKGLKNERGFRGLVTLAMRVSRLWPSPKPAQEGAGPNAGSASGDSAADAASPATAQTGASTG